MSGANKSMIQMIIELRNNHGVEPFIVYPRIYDNSVKNIDEVMKSNNIKGFSHKLSCFQRTNTNILYKLYYMVTTIYNVLHISFLLRNHKFDFVHSNSSVMDTGVFIAKLLGVPHVWHFREVASLSFGTKPILGERYQRWVYGLSDLIIAISNNVKQEFERFIPLDRTIVVPNGILPVNVGCFPNHEIDNYNICVVGRVEANKNQLEAVKAIQILVRRGVKNMKLHIVGNANNEYGKNVKRYIAENDLDSYIIVHGVRYDIPEFLGDMNIGLMLSRHEAFGRVTVEYMMHKLCVIASNTSANPEIINNEKNGLLYEYGDPDDLANKMYKLITNHRLTHIMAEQGFMDAHAKYLSTINSNHVYEIYKSLEENSYEIES